MSTPSSPEPARRAGPPSPARALLGLGLVAVLATLAVLTLANRVTPAAAPAFALADAGALVRPDSPSLGPADAPVTLVEFLDPECESCRAAFPLVKDLLARYQDRLRFVVRYMPLHNNSRLAIAATEAAGEQGQYWRFQELLYNAQPEWGEQSTSQREKFVGYARMIGLDQARFAASLDDPKHAAKTERDRQDGLGLGVSGTPTFFVNGRPVELRAAEDLERAVEAALGR